MRYLIAAVALGTGLLAGACDRQREEGPNAADTLATVVTDSLTADSLAPAGAILVFERTRNFDFDADGSQEHIIVQAGGPAWDSMTVLLRVQNELGAVLYADTFDTGHYGGLDPDPAMTREQTDATIRSQLERILSNPSFMSTAENFDDGNVDLRASAPWMTEDELGRFRDDLMSRPMFRYYVGGESSIGITWSGVLRKFVVTSNCC